MKKILFLCTALFTVGMTQAKVTLSKIFSDGMVMQQNSQANIWGNATANAVVKINVSWSKTT